MKLAAIHHVAIIVSDYEKSKDFYVNKLGFAIVRENFRKERNDWKLDLRVGEGADAIELEIFAEPNPPKRVNRPEACGLRHLAFRVEDVEATVAELEQMGIGCEPIRLDSYTQKKMTFFFDPDGLPLPSRSDQSTTIPNRFLGIVRQVISTISGIEENADRKQLLRELLTRVTQRRFLFCPPLCFRRIYSSEVKAMIESLLMFFIHDALFLLGYLARGSAFPKPLSREEEAEMIARMQQGDERARETLIEHNLRLAAHIARKYTVPGYDSDDLISIGTVGLIKGVGTFKPGTGTQLSTYCARCIENEILMCLRASQKRKGDVSLQEPIGMDGEGNEITLIDVLGTEPEAVHGEVERRVSLQSIRKLVDQSLKGREATVIRMRYGLMDGKTYAQQEVAQKLGVSRSYISRIEKKALERLRVAFETGK